MKKFILLILALTASLGMLFSCKDNDGEGGDTSGNSGGSTNFPTTDENGNLNFGDEGFFDPNGWTKPHK